MYVNPEIKLTIRLTSNDQDQFEISNCKYFPDTTFKPQIDYDPSIFAI